MGDAAIGTEFCTARISAERGTETEKATMVAEYERLISYRVRISSEPYHRWPLP